MRCPGPLAEPYTLPPGGLGLRAERERRTRIGFLRTQERGFAVRPGGGVMMNVIEQQAGMGQKVRVDAEQFAGLPRALPPAVQQRLYLAVQRVDPGEHRPGGQPCMRFGKGGPSPIDLPDRLVTGIARHDPVRKADGVLLRRERWPRRVL
jgi:hypothetical protein